MGGDCRAPSVRRASGLSCFAYVYARFLKSSLSPFTVFLSQPGLVVLFFYIDIVYTYPRAFRRIHSLVPLLSRFPASASFLAAQVIPVPDGAALISLLLGPDWFLSASYYTERLLSVQITIEAHILFCSIYSQWGLDHDCEAIFLLSRIEEPVSDARLQGSHDGTLLLQSRAEAKKRSCSSSWKVADQWEPKSSGQV